MSAAPQSTIAFEGCFAQELPEMAVPWQAERAPDPQLLVLNEPLAAELGFDPAALRTPAGVELLIGTGLPEGVAPVAQAYSGHQFGVLSPRLGDGRALLLGEIRGTDGRLADVHLKGSGQTPFARGGDGLAAVGPMLREYVVSEAMHSLGIPTTRSLSVVATGRTVRRETALPGAVLARVASSHLRVGSFQYARLTGKDDLLRRLADFAIARHHPAAADAENPYLALFEAVVTAQAELVAQWMLVGFIHGVMNTDNMTISGETIDYGPCAFMEAFDPATVYSSIDQTGRYAYANQPLLAEWNLARFAEALVPLIHDEQEQAVALASEALGAFRPQYSGRWSAGMRAKLGLSADVVAETSSGLVNELLPLLKEARADYTGFFRALGEAARGDTEPVRTVLAAGTGPGAVACAAGQGGAAGSVAGRAAPADAGAVPSAGTVPSAEAEAVAGFDSWLERWRALVPDASTMDRVNPVYIPRNHLVEEALAAGSAGDLEPFTRLLAAVTSPYEERPGLERYAAPAPDSFGPYITFCGT